MTPEEHLQKLSQTRENLEQMVREERMPCDVWENLRPLLEAETLKAKARPN
jgi:hypothetical protein